MFVATDATNSRHLRLPRDLGAAGSCQEGNSSCNQTTQLAIVGLVLLRQLACANASISIATSLAAQRHLEFFRSNKPLDGITEGDARDFRNYLLTRTGNVGGRHQAKPLSGSTTRRCCCCAKQFADYA